MLFRYDFVEKLDLTKFRKQAAHYMGSMREVAFDLYLPNYKLMVEVASMFNDALPQETQSDNHNAHMATITLWGLDRNSDIDTIKALLIYPLVDIRFKEFKDIKNIFQDYRANFVSNSTQDSVEKICRILKIISKIDGLRAFL